MATIVYPQQNTSALLQGLQMLGQGLESFRNHRLYDAYRSELEAALTGRESPEQEVSPEQIIPERELGLNLVPQGGLAGQLTEQLPSDYEWTFKGGQAVPIVPERTIPAEYEYSPEQQRSLAQTLDIIGAKYPRSMRIDTSGFYPERQGTGLTYEQRAGLKSMGRAVKAVKDNAPTPNLYNLNDPNDFARAQQAVKQGYTLTNIAPDEMSQMLNLYGKTQYTGEEADVKALQKSIKEKYLSPEERKEVALTNHFQALDDIPSKYIVGEPTKAELNIINRAKERMRRYRARDWSKLSDTDYKALGTITRETINQILRLRRNKKTNKKSEDYWKQ